MHIAIIGGGFTGCCLAIHLMTRLAAPWRISLIERQPDIGAGIAYATPVKSHVLNVRAKDMSLQPELPADFLQWWAQHTAASGADLADRFAPRHDYAQYIRATLAAAIERAASSGYFERVRGEVVKLQRCGSAARLQLADGQHIQADRVVLCLGHFPPHTLKALHEVHLSPQQYTANPWLLAAQAPLQGQAVLLVGTGLSMLDALLTLQSQNFSGHVLAVSRHGLVPLAHTVASAPARPTALQNNLTIRAICRMVRRATQNAGDWRSVIDGLRPDTVRLWQQLPVLERQRFLRHLKPYWDVHRHRVAPEVARLMTAWRDEGRLEIAAARLKKVQSVGAQLQVTLRQRRDGSERHINVDHIVNCTGGHNDFRQLHHPLVRSLLQEGLMMPDALGLGMQVTQRNAVIDGQGNSSETLYVAGPAVMGRDFESIAVPELRRQAAALAEHLTLGNAAASGFGMRPY